HADEALRLGDKTLPLQPKMPAPRMSIGPRRFTLRAKVPRPGRWEGKHLAPGGRTLVAKRRPCAEGVPWPRSGHLLPRTRTSAAQRPPPALRAGSNHVRERRLGPDEESVAQDAG